MSKNTSKLQIIIINVVQMYQPAKEPVVKNIEFQVKLAKPNSFLSSSTFGQLIEATLFNYV